MLVMTWPYRTPNPPRSVMLLWCSNCYSENISVCCELNYLLCELDYLWQFLCFLQLLPEKSDSTFPVWMCEWILAGGNVKFTFAQNSCLLNYRTNTDYICLKSGFCLLEKKERWASLVYFDEKRDREVTITIHQCSWSSHRMLTTHHDHQLSRMIMMCCNISDV